VRTRLVIPAAILVAVAYVKGRKDAQVLALEAGSATPPPPVPGPTHESILRAQAEAADAWEVGLEELTDAGLAAAEAAAAAVAEAPVAEAPVAEEPPAEEPAAEEPAPTPAPVWIPDVEADVEAEMVPEAAPSVFTPRGPAGEPDPVALSEWVAEPAGAAPRVQASGRFSLGGSAVQAGHMALCGVTFPTRVEGGVAAARIRLVPEALQNVAAGGLVVLDDAGFAPDDEGFTILVAAESPGPFAVSGRFELIAGSAG
jgi:hypothetical protein